MLYRLDLIYASLVPEPSCPCSTKLDYSVGQKHAHVDVRCERVKD